MEPIVADDERVPVRVSSLDALARCTQADDERYGELSTAFDESAPPVPTAEGRFELRVEQDGRVQPVRNHEIALHRAPFDLVLTLPIGRGVYVSTSLDGDVFDAARMGRPLLRHFRSFAVVAEELRDADEDLWLDEQPFVFGMATAKGGFEWACEAPWTTLQYLYDDAPEENRFRSVTFDHGRMIARRKVAAVKRPVETVGKGRFRIEDDANVDQPLEQMKENALYVVLVEDPIGCDAWIPAEREAYERKHALQRTFVRLRFVDRADYEMRNPP